MTAAAPAPTDLMDTLEEMRASVAARAARRGMRGTIEGAILRLLSVLLAMLADFRAGRLAPLAVAAERAGDGTVAEASPGAAGRCAGFGVDGDGCGEKDAPTPALRRFAGEGEAGEAGWATEGRALPHRRACDVPCMNARRSTRQAVHASPYPTGFETIFRPRSPQGGGIGEAFFKNASAGEGIGATRLFQYQNDIVMAGG